MKRIYDLSMLQWTLSGWIPFLWKLNGNDEAGLSPNAEVPGIPAAVPGSVQNALKHAGIIPDWNVGLNYRQCEWVENRHWIYETSIPDEWIEEGKTFHLRCGGLDWAGWVYVNGKEAAQFSGTHIPHVFDLTEGLVQYGNRLAIVFDLPPRWLGQFGYTSKMTEWKVRFNYTWDWTARLVQIGIWDAVEMEVMDAQVFDQVRCATDVINGLGSVQVSGNVPSGTRVQIELSRNSRTVREDTIAAAEFNKNGIHWNDLPVDLWWPNLLGEQPLYDLTCRLLSSNGILQDSVDRRVGFKNVTWSPCEGAPPDADPWICVVNGTSVFLQGVNWSPILPNFADVREEDYHKRLVLYKELGINILRVWGGAYLERECFYSICDELGLMVWQEFPLSSSGVENYPPEDATAIDEIAVIARSYIRRRRHHVSLTLWCGGNELTTSTGVPVNISHPLIARLAEVCLEEDPNRRFLATSPSGPRFGADSGEFGNGLHWDVHGPWNVLTTLEDAEEYWRKDDALMRSEVGCPSASPVHIISAYAGEYSPVPGTPDNPLWRRTSVWWVDWHIFVAENNKVPDSLETYVKWSQDRQKKALVTMTEACKNRFPRCGGILYWMGHDCFPCTANTSIVDFEGNPKPAALAIREIFRRTQT